MRALPASLILVGLSLWAPRALAAGSCGTGGVLGDQQSVTFDGSLYYVMPYVEGETLRDRLNREKQLPVEDAVQVAREVATGLQYAHERDVVHRDIKPENILLPGGTAVVADFGIAQAVSYAGGERLTETGVAVGTPAYMSPEQIEGRDVDPRSDIFAFGTILYEMATGKNPYKGDSAVATMNNVLEVTPEAPSQLRSELPEQLAEITLRCLSKEPTDRYDDAGDLLADLKSLKKSIS